jgi:hypothetical protein
MRWIFLFFLVPIFFTSIIADGFKKYASEFIYLGVGGRPNAMGGAYVSVANDVTAGYWNPAGLTEAKGFQIQFMHAKLYMSSIQYDYFGFSNQFESGLNLGLSMIRLGIDDILDSRNAGEFDPEGNLIGINESEIVKFNIADYLFIFSYARSLTDKISYGANIKLIYRNYYIESAQGIGFDFGAIYRIIPSLRLGLMLRDITTTMMAWSTGLKEFIIPSVRPGISYIYNIPAIYLYIQPSLDLIVLGESRNKSSQLYLGGPLSLDTFWGVELGFKNAVFIRLGYDDLERFCAGAGLNIQKFCVDYSYTNFDRELGNVHRISFHLRLNSL